MAGCPSCGAPVGDTDFACRQCGRSFVADPAALAQEMQNQARNAPPTQTWQSAPQQTSYGAPNAYAPNAYAPPGANPYAMPGVPTPAAVADEANLALKHALLGLFCLGFPFGWRAIGRAKRVRSMIARNPTLPGRGKADAAFYIGWFAVITTALGLLDFLSDVVQLLHASSS